MTDARDVEALNRRDLAVARDRALGLHRGPVPLGQVLDEVLDEIGRRVEAARGEEAHQ